MTSFPTVVAAEAAGLAKGENDDPMDKSESGGLVPEIVGEKQERYFITPRV